MRNQATEIDSYDVVRALKEIHTMFVGVRDALDELAYRMGDSFAETAQVMELSEQAGNAGWEIWGLFRTMEVGS